MGIAESENVIEGEADSESGDGEGNEKSNSKRQSSAQTTYSPKTQDNIIQDKEIDDVLARFFLRKIQREATNDQTFQTSKKTYQRAQRA